MVEPDKIYPDPVKTISIPARAHPKGSIKLSEADDFTTAALSAERMIEAHKRARESAREGRDDAAEAQRIREAETAVFNNLADEIAKRYSDEKNVEEAAEETTNAIRFRHTYDYQSMAGDY